MLETPSPGCRTCATPRPSSGPPSCTTHTSPGAVERNDVRRLTARTSSTIPPTTPTRPMAATKDRERGGSRGSRLLGDVNRRTDRDLVVQVDDVRDAHADAAVRGRGADGPRRVGAVDAGTVEDAHPARLERVVRRSAGDDLARERPRPGAVRDAPGGVHGLVLDVVQTGGGLEADLADRDRVGPRGLQSLVERQLERVAVDDNSRAVLPLHVGVRDLRLD